MGSVFLYKKAMNRECEKGIAKMVRMERLELSRREALEPKSSVSTNSTTSACRVDAPNITFI